MSIFSNFFKSSGSSSDIAKNRLKVAITSDRAVCSPELMDQMKNDIIHYTFSLYLIFQKIITKFTESNIMIIIYILICFIIPSLQLFYNVFFIDWNHNLFFLLCNIRIIY